MRRYFERARDLIRRLGSSHGRWIAAFALAIVVVVLPMVVLAQPTPPAGGAAPSVSSAIPSPLTSALAGAISWFLGILVNFLGRLVLLLVNILMGFLTYNDFAHAAPVELGWKILRDLSNMFFIVILLICAFSTIVGYNPDLHIRKVLPKLLFTAVTINFSKTLVGLMIDASQVVMLTFVNAFQAAGVGNFVNALHLQNISAISTTPAIQGTNIVVEVILSYLLAMMMLVLTIGIVSIMIIFVVGRIVGLWMSLIFAPLAFLVGALPGKVAEKVGKLSKDYWPRLNGMLFGGPIIAFFLWLTFATVNSLQGDQSITLFQTAQGGLAGPATSSGPVNSIFNFTGEGTSLFITQIGGVRNLASYLVAITMLMLGLDSAMDAISSAGGFGKGLAETINKKSREYAQRIGMAPITAGAMAARGGWAATKGLGNAIDRRADFSGRAAMHLRRIPLVDKIAGDRLRKIQFARRKEWEEQKQMRLDDYKKSTRENEKKYAKGRAKLANDYAPWLGHQGDEMGYAAILEAEGSQEKFTKRSKELAAPIEKQLLASDPNMHPPLAKNIAAQRANAQAFQERLKSLNEAFETLDPERDKEARTRIEEEIKKLKKENPGHIANGADRDKAMAGVNANLANLTDEQTSDLEVLFNSTNKELRDQAFVQDPTTKQYKIKDEIALSQMIAANKGKPTEKKFDALVSFMRNSPSGVTMDQMRSYSIQKGKDDSYGVYGKTDGQRVITERQAQADAAIKRNMASAQSRRTTNANGVPTIAHDPKQTNLAQAPLGNALLASIPHVGLTDALKSVGDSDGAGTRLIEQQFQESGKSINTYDPNYEESDDYILKYQSNLATDQEKFEAQTKFQQDFQRVESIMADVPSSSVDPNKRIEFMAMMDANRADRFVTAPTSMLEPDQKQAAIKIKEMARTTANSLRTWRNNNTTIANDAAIVDIDVPEWKRAQKLRAEAAAGKILKKSEESFVKQMLDPNSKARQRLTQKGLLDASGNILDAQVDTMTTNPKMKEAIMYNRAYRFALNVAKEGKKRGQLGRH